MKRFILLLTLTLGIALGTMANQQLTIGQSTTVYLNPTMPPGAWITSAGWSTDKVGLNFFDGGTWGTGVKADGYWSGTATLSCFYSFSYYGNDGHIHVGSGNEYWYYTCKGYAVTMTPTSVTLDKGESATLMFSITGAEIGSIPALWESSDKTVATVYSIGDYTASVQAKSPGTCTITCYSYMGEPVICNVTVRSFPPTGISVSPASAEVTVGSHISINCSLTPSGASSNITWVSEDSSIADVKNGRVTGISPGQTRIIVTTANGLSAHASISVIEKPTTPRGPVSEYLSGNGTAASPYLINSASDLRLLADKVNSGFSYENNYIRQTADIIVNAASYKSDEFKNSELWIPIGAADYPFKGHYDGNNFRINGIYMSDKITDDVTYSNVGLFGCISGSASISNIFLRNILVDFIEPQKEVAGLIGLANQVENCTINNCHVYDGEISGGLPSGLVNRIQKDKGNNTITCCSNSVPVSGDYSAGIISFSSKAIIGNCINYGTITGSYSGNGSAAGIVRINNNMVYNCCNAGTIRSVARTSGICDHLSDKKITITHCVNYGSLYCDNGVSAAIYLINNTSTNTVNLENNYYLLNQELTAAKYSTKKSNHALSESEMKSIATIGLLNSNIDATYSTWTSDENGFPTFSWYKETLADIEDAMIMDTQPDCFHSLPDNTLISVYSMSGQLVYRGQKRALPVLRHGVYLITHNNQRYKLII